MSKYQYSACLHPVPNQGVPPRDFLDQLVDTLGGLPDSDFAPNAHADIYSSLVGVLGPWEGILHCRAAMAEGLRVLAALESGWRWEEGQDTTAGQEAPDEMEAGIFQESANSMNFSPDLRAYVVSKCGSDHPAAFQALMKSDHDAVIVYAVMLLRLTIKTNGPLIRGEVARYVRRDAVTEFMALFGK